MSYHDAERLLRELGVEQPHDIDIEAIAYHRGVVVHRCVLDGCEARLLGRNENAIVRVDSRSIAERQRFSIAHELGHWAYDRGIVGFLCTKQDIGSSNDAGKGREARANAYAANLLMPRYMFAPRLGKRLDYSEIDSLAAEFRTSRTATAIRAVDLNQNPAILLMSSKNLSGKPWFRRSAAAEHMWPVDEFHYETGAFELLHSTEKKGPTTRIAPAKQWLKNASRSDARITEHARRVRDRVLVLLSWSADTKF